MFESNEADRKDARLVELRPLNCPRCDNPLPATIGEIAWCCMHCGQGALLDESGLQPLKVQFAASGQPAISKWLPFWVTQGMVEPSLRWTFDRSLGSDQRWKRPQTFVIPAFECNLRQAGEWGRFFLEHPPQLEPGPVRRLQHVSRTSQDALALIEFIVLTIETDRKDQLLRIEVDLDVTEPNLWALPFRGPLDGLKLALETK